MQTLESLCRMVAKHAAQRYIEKRAKILTPLSVPPLSAALALPATVSEEMDAYPENVAAITGATLPQHTRLASVKTAQNIPTGGAPRGFFGQPSNTFGGSLFSGTVTQPLSNLVTGYLNHYLGPAQTVGGIFHRDRGDAVAIGGGAALQGFGKTVGEAAGSLLKDMTSKATEAVINLKQDSTRQSIIKQLRDDDPNLAEASDQQIMDAYHTMVRFAPTLSTDKNAVRSFLRNSIMSGSGPDFVTIKLLAETERAVTNKQKG